MEFFCRNNDYTISKLQTECTVLLFSWQKTNFETKKESFAEKDKSTKNTFHLVKASTMKRSKKKFDEPSMILYVFWYENILGIINS